MRCCIELASKNESLTATEVYQLNKAIVWRDEDITTHNQSSVEEVYTYLVFVIVDPQFSYVERGFSAQKVIVDSF